MEAIFSNPSAGSKDKGKGSHPKKDWTTLFLTEIPWKAAIFRRGSHGDRSLDLQCRFSLER